MEFTDLIAKRQSIRRYDAGDVPEDILREIVDAARLAPSGKNMQNWHFVVIRRRELIDKIADAICVRNNEIASRMEAAELSAPGIETPQNTAAPKINAADRFRKFAKNFTLFFQGAPVLIVVMAQTYLPSGYNEMKAAGIDDGILRNLVHLASPGMQSLGAAIEHLMLRAFDLGYGCCWLTSANYASDYIEDIIADETGFDRPLLKDAPDDPLAYFMAALISVGVAKDGARSPGRKDLDEIMTLV
jgi:nitroreductase